MKKNHQVYKGEHAVKDALLALRQVSKNIRNVLVVSGKSARYHTGVLELINTNFSCDNIYYYSNTPSIVMLSDVQFLSEKLPFFNEIDAIIAIGGGAAIDYSKLIKAYVSVDKKSHILSENFHTKYLKSIPIVAIPTTAGSGSDATEFAVVYDNDKKYSVKHKDLRPTFVALDGTLLNTLPVQVRTISGLDLISQCIEGSWSRQSGAIERALAKKTLQRVAVIFERYISGSNDTSILQEMIECAYDAGIIINRGKTTAAHAWSYGFTLRYGIAHGQAVWLTLPRIIHLNLKKAHYHGDPNLVKHIEEICSILSIGIDNNLANNIKEKIESFGVNADISKLKIDRKEIKKIMSEPNQERMQNNPYIFSASDKNFIFKS